MSHNDLFRPEALESGRSSALFGETLLVWPLSLRLIAATATFILLALSYFLIYGEYSRKAHVKGYLVPDRGFLKVFSPESATILESRMREGSAVKRGDILFVLTPDRGAEAAVVAVNETLARRISIEAEIAKTRAIFEEQLKQLTLRTDALDRERDKLQQEMDLQSSRVATIAATGDKFRRLAEDGFVSTVQVQVQNSAELEQRVLLASLERAKLGLERDLASARAQIPEAVLRSSNEVSALKRQLSQVAQEMGEAGARRQLIIRAPADGTVTALQGHDGQAVNPNVALLQIVPSGVTLQALLLAPTNAVGFVTAGHPVRLRYAAYPFQRFGLQAGEVLQVSRGTVSPGELYGPLVINEGAYIVTVALKQQVIRAFGKDWPLQPGMTVEADIVLDRRALYEWILEPIYAVTGRV